MTEKKKIYVYRIGQLGDSIMACPAIKKISEIQDCIPLSLITNHSENSSSVSSWEVLKYTDCFNTVIKYNSNKLTEIIRIVSDIRQQSLGEDVLYYLPSERSRWQVWRDYIFFKYICGVKTIYGMNDSIKPYIVRDSKGDLVYVENESERLLEIIFRAHKLNFRKYVIEVPLLKVPIETVKKINSSSYHFSNENKVYIAIGHSSIMPVKKWHIDKYKKLCNKLLGLNENIIIGVFGGKEDFDSGEFIRGINDERIFNFAGRTNIIESAALLGKCKLYIGNDTGTMHLAAAMGVTVVGIFSARDNPGRWDPVGKRHKIIRKDVECAGCCLEKCVDHQMQCLQLITVDDVFEIVSGLSDIQNVNKTILC